MIVALQVGCPVLYVDGQSLSDLRFCHPKVDVAQGTVKKRPKDTGEDVR